MPGGQLKIHWTHLHTTQLYTGSIIYKNNNKKTTTL